MSRQLSETAKEQIQSRHQSDRQNYDKVLTLLESVANDQKKRLPFIPIFFRTRSLQQEEQRLHTLFPKILDARAEQFCLSRCARQSSSECMNECQTFAKKAFQYGNNLFAKLHKPYMFSEYEIGEDQE